jgi:hypothetical protein
MKIFKLWNGKSWYEYSEKQIIEYIMDDSHDDSPYEEPGAAPMDKWFISVSEHYTPEEIKAISVEYGGS